MKILGILLWPFSLLYGVITALRNKFYDWGWLPAVHFDDVTIISVGNITVGGTGKTPHVEYLIRLLSDYRVAVLSRGYRRKTKGFVAADAHSTAFDIGDEPCQIKQKFPQIAVAVDADRLRGVRKLKALHPEIQIILLDDAFQHRRIVPTISVLLADYRRPLYRDGMLPGGRMREWACFAERADLLIITKTPPNISEEEQHAILLRYARFFSKSICFTTVVYGKPCPVFPDVPDVPSLSVHALSDILLVTGIAAPQPLAEHARLLAANVHTMTYPDHHTFTPDEIRDMVAQWERLPAAEKCILTTEKDAVRLRLMELSDEIKRHIFYVPITVRPVGECSALSRITQLPYLFT
jgi:tetraacyldisaccharide 4'-kinase